MVSAEFGVQSLIPRIGNSSEGLVCAGCISDGRVATSGKHVKALKNKLLTKPVNTLYTLELLDNQAVCQFVLDSCPFVLKTCVSSSRNVIWESIPARSS